MRFGAGRWFAWGGMAVRHQLDPVCRSRGDATRRRLPASGRSLASGVDRAPSHAEIFLMGNLPSLLSVFAHDMSHKFLLFLAQASFVVALSIFHVVAARLAIRRLRPAHRTLRRWAALFLGLLILVLDLPLIHAFVVYKIFHPLILDQLMHFWASVFIALHANALIFGSMLVLGRYIGRPLKRLFGRLRGMGRPADPGPAASASVPVVPSSMPVPAAAAEGITPPVHLVMPPRRRFLYTAGMAAAGYATSASTLSALQAGREHLVERVVIRVPNLPVGLKGTTIALISDVHSSVFMTRQDMERYVDALNALKADVALVTGDFVNSKLEEVYPFAEAFSRLQAPLGVYGVTGNHDYYTGAIETVAKEVEQAGIQLIRNTNVTVEKKGEKLWLLGMDDASIYDVKPYLETGKSQTGTIENLLRGVPDGAPSIFLCHKPYPFEEYSALGVDVMISGHTHGGQVVLAQLDNVNLSFAALASRYIAGLYKARSNPRAQLYVTRGVGTVGLPLRVNCPPEITHIVLV